MAHPERTMSLHTKVISAMLLVFAALAGAGYLVQRQIVFPSFIALEREEATKNLERVVEAIQRELDLLLPSVADWARWDATYQFMADHDPAYADENLQPEVLAELRVGLLALYRPDGQRHHGLALDAEHEQEHDPDRILPPVLPPDHPLLQAVSATDPVAGLLATPSGPFLFVSHPILTSKGEGPSRGNLVMGRRLDAAALARIAEQARIHLRLQPPEPPLAATAPPPSPSARVIRHTPIELQATNGSLLSSTQLLGLTGQATLGLQVDTTRQITARGEQALRLANLSIGLASALALLLVFLVQRQAILRPIVRLTAHASGVGAEADLGARLDLARNDEIGTLAREFDRMMERLALGAAEKRRLIEELERHRHHLEEMVAERTEQMRRQSQILQGLIDNLPHLAWMKDKDSRYLAVNRRYAELHDRAPEWIVGKSDFDLWPSAEAARFRAEDAMLMARGGQAIREEPCPKEPRVLYEIFKAAIRDADGTVLGTVGLGRDISPQREMEAELARRAELAESATRAKSAFLANMSHEIRTPINAILGLSHLLRRDGLSNSQADRLLKIEQATRHLLSILNDILDLSKIEAHKLRLENADFALGALLDQVRRWSPNPRATRG